MPKYDAERLDALLPCSPLVAVPDARAGALAMASVDLRPLLPSGCPPVPLAPVDPQSFSFELGALPAVAPVGEALALTRPCVCNGLTGLLVAAAQVVDGAPAAGMLPAVAPMREALALPRPRRCNGPGGLLAAAAQVVDRAPSAAMIRRPPHGQ